MTQSLQPRVVCVRYPLGDLAPVQAAMGITGQNMSQFTRTAAVTLAKAIIAAATDLKEEA